MIIAFIGGWLYAESPVVVALTVIHDHKTVMKSFLYSFFLFSMGVQTVMLLAPLFADKEIGMGADEMIIIVLILQILAIGGAFFFAWLSKLKGNGFAISTTLLIWIFICISVLSRL